MGRRPRRAIRHALPARRAARCAGRGLAEPQIPPRGRNDFRVYHGDQDKEYKALAVAIDLAGEEKAYQAASIGRPQILMRGHSLVGYPSAKAMYQAFQAGERAHVLGFFDFCLNKLAPGKGDLAAYMRDRNWKSLARYYNGPGQVDVYAPRFKSAYETAVSLGL